MELYAKLAYETSKSFTLGYSTSFGISTRLFGSGIKKHIYAVYGLVRIADEIVDTYKGKDARKLLTDFQAQTYEALQSGYSTNPIIHAFCLTAKQYHIDETLIDPFFTSMFMDLNPQAYTADKYEKYIFGSAEVVGLMCLKVFVSGDDEKYQELEPGARALGSAYQKVNFLRDVASDYRELGRLYFPGLTYVTLDEKAKLAIATDIQADFKAARSAIVDLPPSSRRAVRLSYDYYLELLKRIMETPIDTLKVERIRVGTVRKLWLFITTALSVGSR